MQESIWEKRQALNLVVKCERGKDRRCYMSMQAGLTWGTSLQFKRPIVLLESQESNNQSPISRLAEEGNPRIPVPDVCCDVTGEEGIDDEDND